MSNLVFLRKFALRFALGLAILGTPHMLLAHEHPDHHGQAGNPEEEGEDYSADGDHQQGPGDPSMAALKETVNQFLSGIDIQGCSSAVNSISEMINAGGVQGQ